MWVGALSLCARRRLHQAVRAERDHPAADRLPGRAVHAPAEADDSAAGDRQPHHRSVTDGQVSCTGLSRVTGQQVGHGSSRPIIGQLQYAQRSFTGVWGYSLLEGQVHWIEGDAMSRSIINVHHYRSGARGRSQSWGGGGRGMSDFPLIPFHASP